jgi:hypothetical protein
MNRTQTGVRQGEATEQAGDRHIQSRRFFVTTTARPAQRSCGAV